MVLHVGETVRSLILWCCMDILCAFSYWLTIGHEPQPLNLLFSEIFSIKVANTQKHADTSTDNKGRLKLAAREPIILGEMPGMSGQFARMGGFLPPS